MTNLLLIQGAFILVALVLIRSLIKRKQPGNLPPGPKSVPLLGNIFDLPPKGIAEYEHWAKHKALYGPLSSVTVLGQTIVIINDHEIATDLLDKQSSKTSGRPKLEFACEQVGWKKYLATRSLDALSKKYRKVIHQDIGTKTLAAKYHEIQNEEASHLLLRALRSPKDLVHNFKIEAGASILKILYGYSIEQHEQDPLLYIIDKTMDAFSEAFVPGAWAVDIFPFLKHLPEGFPFTGFKKTARLFKKYSDDSTEIPYNFALKQMENGSNRTSFVSELVRAHDKAGFHDDQRRIPAEDEEIIKISAAGLYGGGADTTVASLSAFVLAMIRFPDVQHKAQEELDRIIGDRIPQLSDRDSLPYVNAVVSELLRWWPITPLGVPHLADEDITYRGYLIPKDAIILPSIWGSAHDPGLYANPYSFEPERFLPPRAELDPRNMIYGYGRRICPGRYIADSGVFVTVAQMLKVFTMSKAVDHLGREIEPTATVIPGIIGHPRPFPYRIEPRSEAHAQMIRNLEGTYPWEASDAGLLVME